MTSPRRYFALINRELVFLAWGKRKKQGWGRAKERKSQLRRKELEETFCFPGWGTKKLLLVFSKKDVNATTERTELREKLTRSLFRAVAKMRTFFSPRCSSSSLHFGRLMRSGNTRCKFFLNETFIFMLSVGIGRGTFFSCRKTFFSWFLLG